MRPRRGLVVGKFAPLHLGHELVIRRALDCCAELVVISYSNPELPGCGPALRARWLAELFPAARVLVVGAGAGPRLDPPPNDAAGPVHRAFVARLCLEVLHTTVDAVFTSEDYGPPFAAALTAAFRARDPQAPAVQHVAVDPARACVPISASRIRADVHAARRWLNPAVYASFVGRVCLLGGESSGKTTLAETLARRWETRWVPEYGRERWIQQGGALRLEDMADIGRRQLASEEQGARAATRWLFCDTSPLTTAFYSHELFDRVDPALAALLPPPDHYALTVLCAPDFPFAQDGTRRDGAFRERQHAWYLERLRAPGVGPWMLASGSIAQRTAQVSARLDALTAARA